MGEKFRIKPRSKTCQTIFNINNQATGNDNEESGEKLIYKIVEGNIDVSSILVILVFFPSCQKRRIHQAKISLSPSALAVVNALTYNNPARDCTTSQDQLNEM